MALLLLAHRISNSPVALPAVQAFQKTSAVSVYQNQFANRGKFLHTSRCLSYGPYDGSQVRKNSGTATVTASTAHFSPPKSVQPVSEKNTVRNSNSDNGLNYNKDALKEKLVLTTLKIATTAYDIVTLPLYTIIQQPWKKTKENSIQKAVLYDPEKHEWKSTIPKSKLHDELLEHKVDTLDKLFSHALQKYKTLKCLGAREIIQEFDELDASGKPVKKFHLGDYQWKTFEEVDTMVKQLTKSWETVGLKPGQKIAIFAETRAEWLITAMAAFRHNLAICTVFTPLGDDGVVHALTETEITCLVTSEELMPRCLNILKSTPLIKHVVYMDRKNSTVRYQGEFGPDVNVKTFTSMIDYGATQPDKPRSPESIPQRNDPAIIMYTSGSTGVPKGVIISHWNLVSMLQAATDTLASCGDANPDDAYIAFLPLAHALELSSEAMSLLQGIKIGYSSALTLTDKSIGIKEGTKGDAPLLQPSVIISVPLVLERIVKGIQTKIAESGRMATVIFDYFCKYKIGWVSRGYETPLVDRIFFKKIRDLVGGKVRVVICGGAPLAPQTHEFVRTILCAPLVQGYGLTESAGNGILALATDLSAGRVGGPITCSKVRLVNWEEGGYRVTDKPYPRGEIYIGGDNVALGYYKRPENTDFFVENGIRWFKTGDIAEVHPDGGFKIIDRKKDLVKLSLGEFISFGKVEAALKTIPMVENICVCANSFYPRPVAIMVASHPQLLQLARQLRKKGSPEELVRDKDIKAAILSEIQRKAKSLKLKNYEIPSDIHIVAEAWTPPSGLVTAAFKIRRNNVYKVYKNEIDDMLSQLAS